MRAMILVACAASLSAACAAGGLAHDDSGGWPSDGGSPDVEQDASSPPGDASTSSDAGMLDVAADTSDADLDAALDAGFDAGCAADASLGGIGIPAGSTATASASYAGNPAKLAIDGDMSTIWNAGATSGALTITFPSPQSLDGVRLAVSANPASSETYQIVGIQSGAGTVIGSSTQNVPVGTTTLPAIAVTAGTYDAVRVKVTSSQSWAAIAEVSVLTPLCP